MSLTIQDVALRLHGMPSDHQRQLTQLFSQIIDDIEAGGAAATTTDAGVVLQAAAQADSVATDAAGIVTDFNALLAKLRTAGILAP